MIAEIITWGSPDYFQMLALRHHVLRKPLGLVFDPLGFADEKNEILIVLKFHNWVVGCMILTPKGEEIKMRQVAVAPQLQGSGVGAVMVKFAEKIANQKGFVKMALNARDSAIAFYQKLNYHIVGDGFLEVGIPHHFMYKDLGHQN